MERRQFIKKTCAGSCAILGGSLLLTLVTNACKTPLNVLKTNAINKKLHLPIDNFILNEIKIIRINNYDYDIVVKKESDNLYTILILQCTHINQPLTRSGNNFYCTAHGSLFDSNGKVIKGPATQNMHRLTYQISNKQLIIQLS